MENMKEIKNTVKDATIVVNREKVIDMIMDNLYLCAGYIDDIYNDEHMERKEEALNELYVISKVFNIDYKRLTELIYYYDDLGSIVIRTQVKYLLAKQEG